MELRTARLRLRTWRGDNVDMLARLNGDERVMEFMWTGVQTREQSRQWLEQRIEIEEGGGFVVFAASSACTTPTTSGRDGSWTNSACTSESACATQPTDAICSSSSSSATNGSDDLELRVVDPLGGQVLDALRDLGEGNRRLVIGVGDHDRVPRVTTLA